MNIDLKWVLIMSIILSVLGFLAGANSEFVDLGLNANAVKAIAAGFGLLLGVGNAINTVLVAFGMTPSNRIASAASVVGVKSIQVTPDLAQTATEAVNGTATVTTTPSK